MIHTALASAWTALGYDRRATESAQRAFDASKGLGREVELNCRRQLVQRAARLAESHRGVSHVVGVLRRQRRVRIAPCGSANRPAASTRTRSPRSRSCARRCRKPDPRLDIVESQAASALSDYPRELASIQRARQHADAHGLRLLSARAYLFEGRSYFNQGKLDRGGAGARKSARDVRGRRR